MACFSNQNGADFEEATETTHEKWLKQILKAKKKKKKRKSEKNKNVLLSQSSLS